jgi:hypothetical protein
MAELMPGMAELMPGMAELIADDGRPPATAVAEHPATVAARATTRASRVRRRVRNDSFI